jgi:zinc/manganese transport system permease protein
VAGLISVFGARQQERDSAIGVILAFGMGIGVLLLGFYRGFATAATNILFGDIFGVSGSQLIVLLVIGLVVVAVMGTWYRPLLFASIDPDAAEARGVPVGRLGLLFLVVHRPQWEPGQSPRARRSVSSQIPAATLASAGACCR